MIARGKFAFKLFLLTLLLLGAGGVRSAARPAGAARLEGDEAVAFLAEAGILPQVVGDVAPQGRPFLEVAGHSLADPGLGDLLGNAVALDGDTAVVGAEGTDANNTDDHGAAYIFTRSGATWSQGQKLVGDDTSTGDHFGVSVAVDGDTALVGAHQAGIGDSGRLGAAYVFVREGSTWSQQQKLVAEDGSNGDLFGSSVALDGDTALVGAYGASIGDHQRQGAAYVFTRDGTTWSQQQKLVAEDGAADDNFGFSVTLDEGTALIAAFAAQVGENQNQGAAYVFIHDGGAWSQQQKLVAEDGSSDDLFGNSVALDGDTALVGAYSADIGENQYQGAAYVFTRSGATWSQRKKLVAEDGAANDLFGTSVALAGDTALVGSSAAIGENLNQGAVYVFIREQSSWSWQQKLVAHDGAENDWFGRSLALDGDTVLVGAYGADAGGVTGAGKFYTTTRGPVPWLLTDSKYTDLASYAYFGIAVALTDDTAVVGAPYDEVDGTHPGAAYVYTRDGDSWSQQQKLAADDGEGTAAFGSAVAIDGDTVVVGAPGAQVGDNFSQGAAYVFTRTGDSWSQQQKLVAEDGATQDGLGTAVALDGATVLVGASGADVDGNQGQGAGYVFVRDGATWSRQGKLVAVDGADGDGLGMAVALDGETALLGAPLADVDNNEDQGAAYVFTQNGDVWSQQQKLFAAEGGAGDRLGGALALDGHRALVGAERADSGASVDQGAAYLFTLTGPTWSEGPKLVAADGRAGDHFGAGVALDGGLALVGAERADVGDHEDQSAAYVFAQTGPGWSQEQKLMARWGQPGDQFGEAVALAGETAIVGAPLVAGYDKGSVYFFERQGPTQVWLPVVVR